MKINAPAPILTVVLFVLYFNASCSKDSDLLAEYITSDASNAMDLRMYVVDDVYSITPENRIILDVLSNDNFNNIDEVKIVELSTPSNGVVEILDDKTISYTPGTIATVETVATSETTEVAPAPEVTTEVAPAPEVTAEVAVAPEATTDTFTYTIEVVDQNEVTTTETGNVTVNVVEDYLNSGESNNPVQEGSGVVFFNNGFDGGNNDWTDGNPWTSNGGAMTVAISNDAREGNNSIAFRPTPGKERSELMPAPLGNHYNWGTEYWQGFSIKIVEEATGYKIIQQHHATPFNDDYVCSAGANGFAIRDNNGNFEIMTATNQNFTNVVPSSGAALARLETVSVKRNLNQWYDFILHFKYATDNTGFWEVWIDGNKVVDLHNLATVYKYDVCGNLKEPLDYLKIGLYYGNGSEGGRILYDAFRIGYGSNVRYEDVSPLGLSPN